MPTLGKGTECIKLLLSQASKDIQEPLVPMFFPSLGAYVSGAEFMYSDYSWKELCGLMANIVADLGGNKGQLSPLVEAICRDFRQHDKTVTDQLVAWQRQWVAYPQKVLPNLVHHQLPPCCKDFSDYYLTKISQKG